MDEPSPCDPADDAPLHSERRRKLLRAIALVSMAALVIPGAIGSWLQARQSAAYACEIARVTIAPDALSVEARFRLTPVAAAGWQCYAAFFDGTEILIATLGPIPGTPDIRPTSRS